MKTIALIGCGWLGTPLSRTLKRQKARLVATTRSEANLKRLCQEGVPAIR
ncbi:MAG: hypothetical protein D6698_04915, partial [Gammaproteobacteria bacterium]